MKNPVVVRWPLHGPVMVAGEVIACPECRAMNRLMLPMDLDDRSDTPSHMTCPQGHMWADERLTRRLAALLLDEILQADPTLLGRLDELQALQERREP